MNSTPMCVLSLLLMAGNASAALLVGDWGNKAGGFKDVIMEFESTTGVYQGFFASGGGLDAPTDMVFGPNGSLYVSSAGSDAVLRYDGGTGAYLGVATAGGLDFPWSIAFGSDQNLYVANPLGILANTVLRYDGVTGAFIDVFASGLSNVRQVRFGPNGNLYVVDNGAKKVVRFDGVSGAPLGDFATSGLIDPHGIAFGPTGDLFVSDQGAKAVLRFDGSSGSLLGTFATFGLVAPKSLVFGPDGDLYVADSNQNAVIRYDGATGGFKSVFASGSGLVGPNALAFTPPPVPIPAAAWLFCSALGGLGLLRRGRRLNPCRAG
jgi:streptogramin lyase